MMGMVHKVSYKITIEQSITEDKVVQGRWVQLYTDREIDKLRPEERGMGYAPDRVEPVTTRTDLYAQTVDDIDVFAVIAAVNKKETK